MKEIGGGDGRRRWTMRHRLAPASIAATVVVTLAAIAAGVTTGPSAGVGMGLGLVLAVAWELRRGRRPQIHGVACQCALCVAAHQAQRAQYATAQARLEDWIRQRRPPRRPGPKTGPKPPKTDHRIRAAYALLGLQEGASVDEINAAWRREARKYHPDRNPAGADRMRELNKARDLLTSRRPG